MIIPPLLLWVVSATISTHNYGLVDLEHLKSFYLTQDKVIHPIPQLHILYVYFCFFNTQCDNKDVNLVRLFSLKLNLRLYNSLSMREAIKIGN